MRPFYTYLESSDRETLFLGARGVGKTTFLLSRLGKGHFFCFSADNPLATTVPLYDLIEAGHRVFASPSEEEYDFLIDDIRVEVGGSQKSRKGADVVESDDPDVPAGNRIPLWLLGREF